MLTKLLSEIKNRPNLILLAIIILGALLRIIFLDKFPAGFHSQEAIVGYRAFSIVNTGRDELGRFLPLLFTSFRDFQLPFPTYVLVPFVRVFGLSEFSTRAAFAIFGVAAIPAMYGIARKIFPEKQSIALWSVFFLAVNPWSIFLSRTTSEIALSFHLFLIGLWALLNHQRRVWILAVTFLALLASLYSSKVAWFFIPLFLFVLFFTPLAKEFFIQQTRFKVIFSLVLMVFWLPLLFIFSTQPSAKQSLLFNDFSFFTDISTLNYINQMRGESIAAGMPILGKLFFNKSFFLIRIIENFLAHFNPKFLFTAGSGQPLVGLSNFGPILVIFLPITVFGLYLFLKNNKRLPLLLVIWVVLSILPSVFVQPTLNQERIIFLLPIAAFLFSFGISAVKSRRLLAVFAIVLAYNFAFVLFDTVVKEPTRAQKAWVFGFANVADFLKPNLSSYDKIVFTDKYTQDPAPLLLFYLKYPPEKLWTSYPPDHQFGFKNWIQTIGNIQIGKVEKEFKNNKKGKALIISTSKEIQEQNITPLRNFENLNGEVFLQAGVL